MILKGSRREVTLASLCVGCGGLILLWNSLSIAKRPEAAGGPRRKKDRGLSRRSKKQDKGKLFLNLSFCTPVRLWVGFLVYEPLFIYFFW